MKKAIIAMSGGVDSSVAAYLTKNNGFDCIGATMKLFDGEFIKEDVFSTCCSADDIEDARRVCENIGIPYYVFNFKEDFREKVIDKFVKTYELGGTPNPCIECNRYLKFEKLIQKMYELGCDYVVTGHYAVIEERDGRFFLKKGKDLSKDQSYVLYSLTQEQLKHTRFPLGEYTKSVIRTIAERERFINADKSESQDICFVPDGDYAAFIEKYKGIKCPEGNFTDINGNIIGRHKGIIRYTVGQRKGLGVSIGKPAYVISKNIEDNSVVIGDNSDLFSDSLEAYDFNWIYPKIEDEIICKAKIRYNMKEVPCKAYCSGNKVVVKFDNPARAITKGQAVVLYDGEYVIGGGTIA